MAKSKKEVEQTPPPVPTITAMYTGTIYCLKNIGPQEICFIPGSIYTLPADDKTVKSLLAQQLLSIQNN